MPFNRQLLHSRAKAICLTLLHVWLHPCSHRRCFPVGYPLLVQTALRARKVEEYAAVQKRSLHLSLPAAPQPLRVNTSEQQLHDSPTAPTRFTGVPAAATAASSILTNLCVIFIAACDDYLLVTRTKSLFPFTLFSHPASGMTQFRSQRDGTRPPS